MALTRDGSTRWPDAKRLRRLAETRILASSARVRDIRARIGDALSATRRELAAYRRHHAEFDEIGGRMLEQWDIGAQQSLRDG